MTVDPLSSPFGDEPLSEVPLPAAPLVRTLAQVRFQNLSVLAGRAAPARVAESLANDYTLFNESRELAIQVTAEGVTQMPGGGSLWQLMTPDQLWQVTFGHNFLSLHTSAYKDRADFSRRLAAVWQKFSDVVRPPVINRVGFRYINRVDSPEFLAKLPSMVRKEILGGTAIGVDGGELVSSFSDSLYQIKENDGLLARWGILPPNALLDPTLPPVASPSWILDLDSFRNYSPGAGGEVSVADTVEKLSRTAYRFFRWSVTADFLRTFGGAV